MDSFVTRRPKANNSYPTRNASTINHDEPQRPAKRLRTEIPDAESENERTSQLASNSILDNGEESSSGNARMTDFENALPEARPNEEAMKEYESFKQSQSTHADGELTEKTRPLWIKGRSSIYVDAFNLALDTVLDEESHLFDDKEKEVFHQWRELEYEAQFMYVFPISQRGCIL